MKAIEKELKKIRNAENRMRIHAQKNAEPVWKRKLEEQVPEKVFGGLQKAFSKGFYLIFEKGVTIIEKTYDKDALEKQFLIRDYAFELTGGKKEIHQLKKNNARKQTVAAMGSTVEGIGLGMLGIGMPDIVLWLGVLLRSIYETALAYGYDYESTEERFFILKMMEASMQSGERWISCNEEVDAYFCRDGYAVPAKREFERQIEKTASAFATDMLVMKFIQGIPLVGMIGGAANPIYYQKVMRYVQLKYRKRYLLSKNLI